MVVAETQEVDVQPVMERIREAIRRRGIVETTTERSSVSDNGSGSLDVGHLQAVGDLPNVAVTSHRRLFGPIIVAIKKALLKLLTPMLERVPPIESPDPALVPFNQGIERLNALRFG